MDFSAASLEARFSALEAEISSSEVRQRELTRSLIPAQEDRLASLTSGPSVKLGAFGGGGSPEEDGNPAPSSLGSKEQTVSTLTNLAFINLNSRMTRTRLTGLEEELVQSAARLRDLTWSSIPIEEEGLRVLENAIEAEPRVLGVTQGQSGGVPANPSGKETLVPEVVINPVYVKLAQDLAETRVRLATSRREAITLAESIPILENEVENHREELVISQEQEEILNEKLAVSTEVEQLIEDLAASQKEAGTLAGGIPGLRKEVREMREELTRAKATRGDLDSEVTSLRTAHEPAMAELDRLLEIEPRLTTIASLSTIREPALPTSLVAPQRNRNILLAAVLGIMLGGFGALFLGYYRALPPVSRANEE